MTADQQESLYRRWLTDHAGLMWKVVGAFTTTPQDREDLLQDILLQLWMSLPSFRGDPKESTWIYRVSSIIRVNVSLSALLGICVHLCPSVA